MQVMDPKDPFKTLRDAARDFGKLYNGLSINYNLELSTFFYKSTDANGETFYSYTVPEVGSPGMTKEYKPEDIAEASKLGEIVADGHTHGGEIDMQIMDGGKEYSSTNKFSKRDIVLAKNIAYKNGKKEDNGFGKPLTAYVATADAPEIFLLL
nr:DUF4329 domain-containing protein [Chryseobacterium aahli]